MAPKTDTLVKIFKTVTKEPAPTAAFILSRASENLHLNLSWSQRSLDRGKNVKYQTNNIVNLRTSQVHSCLPADVSSELLTAVSKSSKLKAVVREISSDKNSGKKSQHLEIWNETSLVSTLDLTAFDVHGDVYCDSEFGSLEWSQCEQKLLYIAEKKVPKSEPFYKVNPQESEEKQSDGGEKKTAKGEEYTYRQDWGEALVGKHRPVIVVCDLNTEKLLVQEGVPEELSPGQVTWAPGGGIVGVGWKHVPRRLGLIYCTNRSGCIFHLTNAGNFCVLSSTKDDIAVRSPRFNKDRSTLVWLERPAKGPHHGCHRLVKYDWASQTLTNVVDIVQDSCKISDGNEFYGLYSQALPSRCFVSSNELVISTPQKFAVKSYIVNVETKNMKEIPFGDSGSLIVLDVFEDLIVCAHASLRKPAEIKLTSYKDGRLQDGFTVIKSTNFTLLDNFIVDHLSLEAEDKHSVSSYSAIFLGPARKEEKKSVPLILIPHGGPHSAVPDSYSVYAAFFASIGFGVLYINFRGSIGQGQRNVDFLPGRVGDTDVKDCHNAGIKICEKYEYLDPNNIVLYGGSHGGFLVTHLSGQYPSSYKAVVARNPVVNVLSAFYISDIPDWGAVESGFTYTGTSEVDLTPEQLAKMREVSPLRYAHQVKAPTLLLLGKKDLRVPMSQGLIYYNALKALDVKTKVLNYEDNHPLSQVPVEIDALLNSALWLMEHTGHNI